MTIPTADEARALRAFAGGTHYNARQLQGGQSCLDAGWLVEPIPAANHALITDAGREALARYDAAHPPITHLKPGEPTGIPMLLTCPGCGERHLDEGEWETRPHHTHACQSCGMVWRPAIVNTVGVRFLPGFRNEGGQQ